MVVKIILCIIVGTLFMIMLSFTGKCIGKTIILQQFLLRERLYRQMAETNSLFILKSG